MQRAAFPARGHNLRANENRPFKVVPRDILVRGLRRITLGCGNQLAQQIEHRDKSRLRVDELAFDPAIEPKDGFFRRRRDVEIRLVAIRCEIRRKADSESEASRTAIR